MFWRLKNAASTSQLRCGERNSRIVCIDVVQLAESEADVAVAAVVDSVEEFFVGELAAIEQVGCDLAE